MTTIRLRNPHGIGTSNLHVINGVENAASTKGVATGGIVVKTNPPDEAGDIVVEVPDTAPSGIETAIESALQSAVGPSVALINP